MPGEHFILVRDLCDTAAIDTCSLSSYSTAYGSAQQGEAGAGTSVDTRRTHQKSEVGFTPKTL